MKELLNMIFINIFKSVQKQVEQLNLKHYEYLYS